MSSSAADPSRIRIAVFGSVAAEGSPRRARVRAPAAPSADPSPSVRAVLERVLASIALEAPQIAAPVLEHAVATGDITRAERHELQVTLADPQTLSDAPRPAAAGSRRALGEALAAIRRAAPAIAEPILLEAIADERLTEAQSERILGRLRLSPSRTFGRRVGRVTQGVS